MDPAWAPAVDPARVPAAGPALHPAAPRADRATRAVRAARAARAVRVDNATRAVRAVRVVRAGPVAAEPVLHADPALPVDHAAVVKRPAVLSPITSRAGLAARFCPAWNAAAAVIAAAVRLFILCPTVAPAAGNGAALGHSIRSRLFGVAFGFFQNLNKLYDIFELNKFVCVMQHLTALFLFRFFSFDNPGRTRLPK